MDFTEPEPTLVTSVWAEVDATYPSLILPEEPTEEEQNAYDEQETLRSSEFSSRYVTQRQAQIDADRLTLSQDEQDRLAAWDAKPSDHQPTDANARSLALGLREKKLREWVAAEIERAIIDARKVWEVNYDFLMEFTKAERKTLRNHNDDEVADLWVQITTWQGEVHSDDPRIVGGLDLIEFHGVIDATRRAEILAKD